MFWMKRVVVWLSFVFSCISISALAVHSGKEQVIVQMTGFQPGYYELVTENPRCIEGHWSLKERDGSVFLLAAGTPMVSSLGEPALSVDEPTSCQSSSQGSYTRGQMVQVSRVSCPGRSTVSTRRTITFTENTIRYSQVDTVEGKEPVRTECELEKKPDPYTPPSSN